MAESSGFYMTLPSDGSMASFSSNTTAQFKTLLPQTVDLTDGEWEVALTEMMYPNSLKNITEEEAYFDILIPQSFAHHIKNPNVYGRFKMKTLDPMPLRQCPVLLDWAHTKRPALVELDKKMEIRRIHFRSGPYVHPKALTEEISLGLERSLKKIWKTLSEGNDQKSMKLVYYETYDRVMYEINEKMLTPLCIRFPTSLAYKLGIDGQKVFLQNDTENMTKWINISYLGNSTVDLYENLKSMYVYCDLIQPQTVGSNALKLLRVVPCTFHLEDSKQAKWEPIRAEYLKLSKKHFDTIEIHIMTPLGTPMPFVSGKSVVKLHFRKVY